MKIYIAGKYMTGDTAKNIGHAKEIMVRLICAGHAPFCPHTMFAGLEHVKVKGSGLADVGLNDECKEVDLQWLEVCDAIMMLKGWEISAGSRKEYQKACELGLKIYYEGDM